MAGRRVVKIRSCPRRRLVLSLNQAPRALETVQQDLQQPSRFVLAAQGEFDAQTPVPFPGKQTDNRACINCWVDFLLLG